MLRCRSIASLRRTVSTPSLVDFSGASPLDLFEQSARGFIQHAASAVAQTVVSCSEYLQHANAYSKNDSELCVLGALARENPPDASQNNCAHSRGAKLEYRDSGDLDHVVFVGQAAHDQKGAGRRILFIEPAAHFVISLAVTSICNIGGGHHQIVERASSGF
jgi:hypothetical protein